VRFLTSSFDLAPLLYGKTMALALSIFSFVDNFLKINLSQQIGGHIRNGLVANS
jgi:hypothetical protein